MKLYINSDYKEIPDNIHTIGKLIDFLKISRQGTGVGLNNRLIPTLKWDSTSIKNDDRIMIIAAAYGG